jgi:hypothetical protein
MRATQRLLALSAISCLALGIASTATAGGLVLDPIGHMPYGYATTDKLSADKVKWQDDQVLPRCEQYAKETVPGAFRLGLSIGVNHLVAGAVGGGLGAVVSSSAEYSLLHIVAGPQVMVATAAGGALSGGVQGGFNGYVGGAEQANQLHHATVAGCMLNDVAGLHQVPPSVAHKIESGELPEQDFRAPWQHRDADATSAPVTQSSAQ